MGWPAGGRAVSTFWLMIKASVLLRPIRLVALLLVGLVAVELGLPMGCIGVQAISGRAETNVVSRIRAEPGQPGMGGMDSIRTRADAVRLWGDPLPRRAGRTDREREVWKYRSQKRRWRGVWLWAVVPVPLLAPTGSRAVWLEFRGDSLRRVTTRSKVGRGYGLVLEPESDGNEQRLLGETWTGVDRRGRKPAASFNFH